MKTPRLLTALALLASLTSAFAQLNIPAANGSDLAFNPTANVEVDLSNAVPGDALTYSNSGVAGADRGRGIYDAARWVVVYKYSSVNIPTGVTVTFKNHPSYAPVVWLVQGSVNIAGTVSMSGKGVATGPAAGVPTEPGPGGFRGGAAGPSGNGAGLGPGGGNTQNAFGYNTVYGNPQIIPLIGGSGGAGVSGTTTGESGAGAILIATPTTVAVSGAITAQPIHTVGWGGTGGAIKLIADQVNGTGTLNASTTGRVRIEANTLANSIVTTPSTIAVQPGIGATPTLFQSLSSPTVKIVSVDGLPSPVDPTAPLVSAADIAIQKNTPVTIVLRTENFATAGAVVALRIANKYGGATTLNATLQGGGTTTLSTWTLSTTLAPGFVTLQARATQP